MNVFILKTRTRTGDNMAARHRLTKNEKDIINNLIKIFEDLDIAGKPELTGMKLEASVQSTKSPPTIGQKTYRFRKARERLNDKIQSAIDEVAAVLGGEVSKNPVVSKRCRKRKCTMEGKRQRDSLFCRQCGSELSD